MKICKNYHESKFFSEVNEDIRLSKGEKMFKRNLAALLGALGILASALTTPLMAGSIGIGVSGASGVAGTEGHETLKTTSVRVTAERWNNVTIPSMYAQYTFGGGYVIGIDYVPGEAELGAESVTKNDLQSGESTTSVTQKAQAELSNHVTLYAETPAIPMIGLYLKAGVSHVTIATNESLGTGAAYGDEDVTGVMFGLGFKHEFDNGALVKLDGLATHYEDVSLSSTGSDAATTIHADTELYQIKLSVGYNF